LADLLKDELNDWIEGFVNCVPGRTGSILRRAWFSRRLAELGPGSVFEGRVRIGGCKNIRIGRSFSVMSNSSLWAWRGHIEIGDRVSMNSNVIVDACDDGVIRIGNDVLIGPNVVMRASNHVYKSPDRPINRQGHTGGTIVVRDDVWIASNVVIVPGVTIGEHSVISACSLVSHDVEPWTVVGGVPAAVIKRREQ
jgi:galactoside O-acetyltransferase